MSRIQKKPSGGNEMITNFKDIFKDFYYHLVNDEKPSSYFNEIFESQDLSNIYPLTMLSDLKKVNQSKKHHPEGNVWNHTMLVVDYAAVLKRQSADPAVLMWSALLHDLGKVPATKEKNGKITAYDHDKMGVKLAKDFLAEFKMDEHLIDKTSKMVRWHMQVLFVSKNLPFAHIKQMLSEVPLSEIALLSLCDRLGRGDMTAEMVLKEEGDIERFIKKCNEFA